MKLKIKEIGTCSLCGAIIYSGDNWVKQNGSIFCTQSCADEVGYILDGGEVRQV